MDVLFAPWRTKYTTEEAHTKNEDTTKQECMFGKTKVISFDLDEIYKNLNHTFKFLYK